MPYVCLNVSKRQYEYPAHKAIIKILLLVCGCPIFRDACGVFFACVYAPFLHALLQTSTTFNFFKQGLRKMASPSSLYGPIITDSNRLGGKNYGVWKYKMKNILVARKLWDIVVGSKT